MKALWNLLTGNLGLKLLALALAIVLYHALKPTAGASDKKHDRTFLK